MSATTLLRIALSAGFAIGSATAQFFSYGTGCGGTVPPQLVIDRQSHLESGEPYSIDCYHVPAGAPAFLSFGFLDASPGVSLASYGMPGCLLWHSADVSILMTTNGNIARGTLTMPVVPCGLALHAQAAVLNPSANAAGVAMSNAARLVIDPVSDTFWHTAFSGNTTANWTVLDEPTINGRPDAVFLAQQHDDGNWASDCGVWYNDSIARWTIFRENTSAMPSGSKFMVLLPNSGATQFQWNSTPTNTYGHIVTIDHPGLNGRPDLHLQVTKLYRSGSGLAGYHTAPIGVWYDGQRWTIFNEDLSPMPTAAAFQVVAVDEHFASGVSASVQVQNVHGSGFQFGVRYPDYARVFLTQIWAPNGGTGIYNPRLVRPRRYDPSIFSPNIPPYWACECSGQMTVGTAVNVLIMGASPLGRTSTHVATGSGSPETTIDALSGPLLATSFRNPSGSAGVYNPRVMEVASNQIVNLPYVIKTWSLRALGGNIPAGAAFQLIECNESATALTAVASASNTSGAALFLSHPALNGNAAAVAFVQPLVSAGNNHPVGLRSTLGAWQVINLDNAPMPAGARFQVVIADDNLPPTFRWFRHPATPANSFGSVTTLDHPDLNGRPDAHLVVTQKVGTASNGHVIGVQYDAATQRWSIFNEDLAPVPFGAEFHVLYEIACQ
ncbi:MAG: hypothetical protein KDE27_30330 [Planctomycetes bacterium]|nr:hypothetical protein [Planctomycetota bacterium]